ncbi:ATP-dependent DNA helicase II subunit 1, partial [Tulasnella sp. 427]
MATSRDAWDITADEDDELEDTYYETAKETILFCIDASESMHQRNLSAKKKRDQRSNLHAALECAADLQKRLVLFNPSTSVGILLYNTEERDDGEGGETNVKEHHQLIQTIKQINAPQIQALLSTIARADNDPNYLKTKYAPAERQINMATVFSCCTGIFRHGAPKTSVKRVFLITDNDTPPSNPHDISVASRTYLDLTDFGATVVPFFISNKAESFDITKFYSHVFTDLYEGGSLEPIPDPVTGFDELTEEMRIRESVKRALFTAPLQLGDGLTIGVKGLVMEMRRGLHKRFANMGQRMEDVVGVTTFIDSEQQIEVDKSQIMFGMKSVAVAEADEEEDAKPTKAARRQPALFTAEQVKEFKTLGIEPGLSRLPESFVVSGGIEIAPLGIKILGFKDRNALRFQDQIKHAYFIYPDESVFSGSTRTFNALLKATINRNKVALVRFMPRRASTPVFAILLPQAEKVTGQGQQVPPGFHVITLPFADDIRAPDLGHLKGAAEEQTDLACKIIEKLTLKGQGYVPDTYLNPALGLHYGQLQATAFNEAFDPEEYVDTTVPNYEMIHKRAGEPMKEWKEMLEEDPEANIIVATVKKSTATGTKRKADDSGTLDEMHVRDYYNDGRITKLTVAQLKAFLKSKALPVSGNKAELVERAENCYLPSYPENCIQSAMASSNYHEVESVEQFKSLMEADLERTSLLSFWAPWAAPCTQMNEVVKELAKKHQSVLALSIEAENLAEIAESFDVEAVPTFVLLR